MNKNSTITRIICMALVVTSLLMMQGVMLITPTHFADGNIIFNNFSVGTYGALISTAKMKWNSGFISRGYHNTVYLTGSSFPNNVVSLNFTVSAPYEGQFGWTKVYNPRGIQFVPFAGEVGEWGHVYMYVFPAEIIAFSTDPDNNGTYILKTTVHEFGHCLSLCHPAVTDNSIMKQGLFTMTTPSSFDFDNIHTAWFN